MKKRILALLMALAMVLTLTACIKYTGIPGVGSSSGGFSRTPSMVGVKQETFVFHRLPRNVNELRAMPEAALSSPFMTAALTVAALCAYGENPQASIAMLNILKGPEPLSPRDIQFLRERFVGKAYKPFSYFEGATPQNGYAPSRPYRITVSENSYSYTGPESATLYIQSGGADSPRPVSMKLKPSTGQWFLTEYSSLLVDIRVPDAKNPWK